MRFRELLQYELWSKKTHIRIFIGIGVLIGVVFLMVGAHDLVEQNWITPGERGAAKSALEKLDGLQDAGFLNDKEFVMRAKMAERNVDDARQAARTRRDRKIISELMSFQSTIVANHAFEQKQVQTQQQDSSRRPVQRMQGLALAGLAYDSTELHKALD